MTWCRSRMPSRADQLRDGGGKPPALSFFILEVSKVLIPVFQQSFSPGRGPCQDHTEKSSGPFWTIVRFLGVSPAICMLSSPVFGKVMMWMPPSRTCSGMGFASGLEAAPLQSLGVLSLKSELIGEHGEPCEKRSHLKT